MTSTGTLGSITLDDSGNDFLGPVSLNTSGANNVIVRDASNLNFGASTLGTGTFTVNAVGITQTAGVITQAAGAGNATFNAGAGQISLSQAGNDFTGNVILNNREAFDVVVRDGNAISLGASSLGSGNLQVDATGANPITQVGAITQQTGAGGATFTTGAGAITLTHVANAFTGPVSLNNSGASAAALRNASALTLGLSNLAGGGALSVTAGGSITQTGAVTAGTATFSVGAAGSDILMALAPNNFSGFAIASSTAANVRDFALRNDNAGAGAVANLGNNTTTSLRNLTIFYNNAGYTIPSFTAVSSLRDITITANGAGGIAQSVGGVITAGTVNLTSGGAISLNEAVNNFAGTVNASVTSNDNISLRDSDSLVLGNISMGNGNLSLAFGKNIQTNLGLNIAGRIRTGGNLTLTPTAPGSDILLGTSAGNANDIAGSVTIDNNTNVRDFVLRNINSGAGAINNLATAVNLRDVSINYPQGTYTVPTFTSTSFRDLSVYAQTVTLGGALTSLNGSIELYQANATGTFTIANNINTPAGSIRLLSDGNLTVNTGVSVGSQTTGSIGLFADSAGSGVAGSGTLNLAGTATIGNPNNSDFITLQAADLTIAAGASVLQGAGTVVLNPSTLTAAIGLGGAGTPAATFIVTGLELGRIFSSGTVQLGAESQVGNINIESINLTANTFGTLKLVGSSAASALLANDATLRTFGIGLNFDVNVDLGDNLFVIDTTQAGFSGRCQYSIW